MQSRIRMEIKEVSEQGTFEGWLSTYGNVDEWGDMVMPGAFTKTLLDRGNSVPMLWQHQSAFPIGTLTLTDKKEGLWCEGKLEMGLQKAQEAYICLKANIVKGLSIGFRTVQDSIEKGVRQLKEIKLYEGSVVTFPMNELAQVTSVKSVLDAMDADDPMKGLNDLIEKYLKQTIEILESVRETKKDFEVNLKALQDLTAALKSTADAGAVERTAEPGNHSEAWVSDMLKDIKSLIPSNN